MSPSNSAGWRFVAVGRAVLAAKTEEEAAKAFKPYADKLGQWIGFPSSAKHKTNSSA